ncbi:GNAT family N-acetyltransferase [Roseateles sp. NT4]|uniref:GNAT family N-acetyltransferase n=1 Tax=Roseateles sp. NT4 TaxID=3453715 RepID=UPI003EEB0700
MTSGPPASPIADLVAIELTSAHVPALQRFFAANPAYFLAVQGEPARPDDAREEIEEALPEGIPHTKKWVIGYVRADGEIAALANFVADIFAPSVWNVSTFIVETARHGSGDARRLYDSLEAWARQSGARWLRLGVVIGNARAERFWASLGYVETRVRSGYQIGNQVNELRVMCKPLAGGPLSDYLALVPRDRPELAP